MTGFWDGATEPKVVNNRLEPGQLALLGQIIF